MAKADKKRMRIVWAIDAYGERDFKAPNACARTIQALARRTGAETEPVYVLSLARSGDITYAFPRARPHLSQIAEALREFMKAAHAPATLAPRVVTTGGDSNAVRAKALARHARSEDADLIVVGSHARKGAARLFLGSFAESLMLWTPSPLLVVNPTANASREFKRVLFPTDLGPASRRAFLGFLEFASRLEAKIEVLHVARRPFVDAGVYVIGTEKSIRAESDRARRDAVDRAAALVSEARRAGVKATASVMTEKDDGVSETIIDAARRSGSQMIAMAAQSGNWRAALAGSVARQVVRGAACPVLILRGPR